MEQLKLLFAGDFCSRLGGLANLSDEIIEKVTAPIKKITSEYDISLINIETVFTDEPTPVKKSGPALSSPLKALDLLKSMNFKIGAFANNHVCDQGEEQGLKSKELVSNLGMKTLGCGKNLDEANKPLRMEVKGTKISILNFAENEFTAATPWSFGLAPIDMYENNKQIKAEKEVSDLVFVYIHAGNETCPFPRTGVKKLTKSYIESGADGVFISHPHTVQGIEYYMEKPIVYSTGNFFMGKRSPEKSLWNFGYMIDVLVDENKKVTVKPIPYEFGSDMDYFEILEGDKKEKFMEYINYLSDFVKNTDAKEYKMYEYAWSILYMEESWECFLEEMTKDMSPDGDFMLFVKNAYTCDSHQEVMQNFFEVYTTNRLNEFDKYKKHIRELQNIPF